MSSNGRRSRSLYEAVLGWLSDRPLKATVIVTVIVALSVWHIVAG